MPLTSPDSHVLIIAGMHRSGTSLLANWLQQCGLNIGDELAPGGVGNPLGHFEDMAFQNFHQAVLHDNHLDTLVTDEKIEISDQHTQMASAIIASHSLDPQWGWKDPRTCLFLAFWKDLLPEAHVLCIFRHPADVVDSFRRRAKGKQQRGQAQPPLTNPVPETILAKLAREYVIPLITMGHNVRFVRFYLKTWTRHNLEILHFAELHPADIVFVRTSDLQDISASLVDFLVESWGFELKPADFEAVYQEDMMKKGVSFPIKLGILILSPSSALTYRRLLRQRAASLRRISTTAQQAHQPGHNHAPVAH